MIKADIAARERTIHEISCLGLDTNLRDLEVQGYTVVNGVLTKDQIEKAKDAILRRVKKKTGRSIDPEARRPMTLEAWSTSHISFLMTQFFQKSFLSPKR